MRDRDIAEILQALFTDEGYRTSCLYHTEGDAVLRAVGRLEPDVILLDSGNPADYGARRPTARRTASPSVW